MNLKYFNSPSSVKKFASFLRSNNSPESTISRKLSSINSFSDYLKLRQIIAKPTPSTSLRAEGEAISPGSAPSTTPPFFNKYLIWSTVILILLGSLYGLYTQVILKATKQLAYSTAANPTIGARILSFQGRLTDSASNPIISSTGIIFKLFNSGTGGTELYTSGTGNSDTIIPDENGIFNAVIGKSHGDTIPSSVFTENAEVWLEITTDSETMTPRQQIATVAYALNAETLQGMPPSASGLKNTVLVIGESGNIYLGETSPSIISSSGTFGIEGQALLLKASDGSGGNITINPDANGIIQLITEGSGSTAVGGFIDASNANLSTGNLFNSQINNDNQGYNFLSFSNYDVGTTTTNSRFSVSASGNVNISNNLNAGGTITFSSIPLGVGTTILYINSTGVLSQGTLPASVIYTATNGLNLNSFAFGLGGSLTENTQIGTSSFGLGIGTAGNSLYNLSVGGTASFNNLYTSGNVGIGATNPGQKLYVSGNTIITGNLGVGTVTNATSKIHIEAANAATLYGGNPVGNQGISVINSNDSLGTPYGIEFGGYHGYTNSGIYGVMDSLGGSTTGDIAFALRRLTSDTNFTETMRITHEGNVGIGTTSPIQKLDVNGSLNIGGSMSIGSTFLVTNLNSDMIDGYHYNNLPYDNYSSWNLLSNGTGSTAITSTANVNFVNGVGISLSQSGSTITINNSGVGATYNSINGITNTNNVFSLGGTLATNTRLNIGNTEVLYINFANGYIGIGTTDPLHPLSVSGNIIGTSNLALNGGTINNNYGVELGSLGNNSRGINYSGTLTSQNTSLSGIYNTLSTGGIGLTNAINYDQYVNGVYNDITINSSNNGSSYAYGVGQKNVFNMATGTSSPVAVGSWNTITNFTDNSPLFFGLLNSGNKIGVGITTSTSNASLIGVYSKIDTTGASSQLFGEENHFSVAGDNSSVYGQSNDIAISGNNSSSFGNYNQMTTGADLLNQEVYGGYSSITLGDDGDTGVGMFTAVSGSTTNAYAIYSAAGKNVLIGNVGIGTASPLYKLHVNGDAMISSRLGIGSTDVNYALNVGSSAVMFGGNLTVGGTVTFTSIPLGTGSTVLFINSSGNLVQGTMPTAIYTATNGLNLTSSAFGLGGTLTANTNIGTSSFTLNIGQGNTQALYIASNGNVGIGKTNPGQKLHVAGNVGIDRGVGGYYFLLNGALRAGIKSSANNELAFATGADTEAMRIDSTGNVGIGTTSPLYKFHVSGDALISTRLGIGSTDSLYMLHIGGTTSTHNLNISNLAIGTTGVGATIVFIDSSGNLYKNIIGAGAFTNGVGTTYNADNGLHMTINTVGLGGTIIENTNLTVGNTSVFSINSSSGYVGIGLATGSSAPLHVETVNPDGLSGYFKGFIAAQKFIDLDNYANYYLDLANATDNSASLSLERAGSIRFNATYNSGWKLIQNGPASKIQNFYDAVNANGGLLLGVSTIGTSVADIGTTWDSGLFISGKSGVTNYVGIGTTSPGYKLDVSGMASVNGIQITNDSTETSFYSNIGYPRIYNSSSGGVYPFTENGNLVIQPRTSFGRDIVFATGTTSPSTRMIIDRNGSVGIGTTSPGTSLDVWGVIRSSAGSATGAVRMNPGDASNPGYFSWYQPNGTTRIAYMGWGSGGANNLNINLENSANFNINGGNVGIGTTSPGYKLEVAGQIKTTGTGSAGNIYIADETGYGYLVGGNSTSGPNIHFSNYGRSGFEGGHLSLSAGDNDGAGTTTSQYINLYTNSTERMRINRTGNVGIGTTSPVALLNLVSPAATTIQNWGYNDTGSATLYNLALNQVVTTANVRWSFDQTNNGVSYPNTLVLTTGNVGIGTTSPIARFDINHAGTANAASTAQPMFYLNGGLLPQFPRTLQNVSASISTGGSAVATGPTIGLNLENSSATDNTFSPFISFSRRSASGNYNDVFASIGGYATSTGPDVNWVAGDLVFHTQATTYGPLERLRITSAGSVGIGTAAPIATLSIVKSSANAEEANQGFALYSGLSDTKLQMGAVPGAYSYIQSMQQATNWSNRPLSLQPQGGNVGIGTTSPSVKLEISGGGIHVTGSAQNPASGSGQGLEIMGGATPYIQSYDRNASAYLPFQLVTSATVGLYQNISGHVGIGTTSPSQLLDVNGILNIGGTSNTSGNLRFSASNPYISAASWIGIPGGAYFSSSPVYTVASIRARGGISNDAGSYLTIGTGTSGTTYMSGTVGIGTSSPGSALAVKGAGQFTWPLNLQNSYAYTNIGTTAYWNVGPDGANNFVVYNGANVGMYMATGNNFWSGTSDARLKTNIQKLDSSQGINAIRQLNPVTYNWKDAGSTGTNLGFIAQEIQQIFPELVSNSGTRTITLSNGTTEVIVDALGMNYTSLIVPAISAIQELDTQLNNLSLTTDGQVNVEYNVSPEILASLGYTDTKNEIENAIYSHKINTGLVKTINLIASNIIANKVISPEIKTTTITPLDEITDTIVIDGNIQANEASFSMVYADQIINKDGNITDVMAQKIADLRSEITNLMTTSTPATPTAIAIAASTWETSYSTASATLNVENISITNDLIIGANLIVNGQTTLSKAYVTDTLAVGQIAINSNNIETTSDTLFIQPSGVGAVNILNSKLIVSDDGSITVNAKIAGTDANFSGSLIANLLKTPNLEADTATIGKLIIASSSTLPEITTTTNTTTNATAGTTALTAGTTEITINNPKLTQDSMVYLTPNGSTQNQVVYVKNKNIGDSTPSFTIGIDSTLPSDLSVNWWIIN